MSYQHTEKIYQKTRAGVKIPHTGLSVKLVDIAGVQADQVLTDSDSIGHYTKDGIPAGSYYLKIDYDDGSGYVNPNAADNPTVRNIGQTLTEGTVYDKTTAQSDLEATTTDPEADHLGENDGYTKHSILANPTTEQMWFCIDPTDGAEVWLDLTADNKKYTFNYTGTSPQSDGLGATEGYSAGSIIINPTANRVWICVSPTNDSEIWIELTGNQKLNDYDSDTTDPESDSYGDSEGYSAGSIVANPDAGKAWICLDPTDDAEDWLELGGGSDSSSTVTTTGETLDATVSTGQFVYYDSVNAKWKPTDDATAAMLTAQIAHCTDQATGKLTHAGIITGTGLTKLKTYYLNPDVDGDLTATQPATNPRAIGIALSATEFLFIPNRFGVSFKISTTAGKLQLTYGEITLSIPVTTIFGSTPTLVTKQYLLDNLGGMLEDGGHRVFTGVYDETEDYINTASRRDCVSYSGTYYEYVGEDLNNALDPDETAAGLVVLDKSLGINIINSSVKSALYNAAATLPAAFSSANENTLNTFINGDHVLFTAANMIYCLEKDKLLAGEVEVTSSLPVQISGDITYTAAAQYGNYYYVACRSELGINTLQIFELDTTTGILSYETMKTLTRQCYTITVTADRIYCCEDTQMEIFANATDYDAVSVGSFTPAGLYACAVDEVNDKLYAACNQNLYIYDISTLSAITLDDTLTTPVQAREIIKDGSYLYLTDGDRILIVNLPTAASLSLSKIIEYHGEIFRKIHIAGDYLYTLTAENLIIYDISTPASAAAVTGAAITIGANARALDLDTALIKEWLTYTGTFSRIDPDALANIDLSLLDEKTQYDDDDILLLQEAGGTRKHISPGNLNNRILHDQTCAEAAGKLVALNAGTGEWENCDNTAEEKTRDMLGIHLGDGEILLHGIYTTTGLTADQMYFVGTSGAWTATAPTASGSFIRVIGAAISATKLWFNPQAGYMERT